MSSSATLARWIVEKGIDNIDPSMLSDELKKEVLTDAGMMFFKEGRLLDAIKCLKTANNPDKLLELGDEFMRQNRFEQAALCYIPAGDRQRTEKVAEICLKEEKHKLAYESFLAAGNDKMAFFLRENFLEEIYSL